jgi:hypothetical protein
MFPCSITVHPALLLLGHLWQPLEKPMEPFPTLENTMLDYAFENTIYFTENKIIHSSTLMMEAAGPSGMLLHFYQMTVSHPR